MLTRWLVYGTVVLDPGASEEVLDAVEDLLADGDIHVFRGRDVAEARGRRRLTFAVLVEAPPDADAVNDAVLEVHHLVTTAGARVLRIVDRAAQRMG